MVGIVTAVVAVVSLGVSIDQGNKAARASREQAAAQKEAVKVQGRQDALEAQRERIKQVRAARIARAQVLSGASASGVGAGSSGVAGATASIGSQLASNIGDIGVRQSFAEQTSAFNVQAADAASRGATAQAKAAQWQAIGNFSTSIFTASGGFATTKPPVVPAIK